VVAHPVQSHPRQGGICGGVSASGIQIRRPRCENDVGNTLRPESRGVRSKIPRIGVEILSRTKLRRVHENRYDDDVGESSGLLDKAEVSVVKRAHRRHECDPASGTRRALRILMHPNGISDDVDPGVRG